MTIYSFVLFVHIVSTLGIAAALTLAALTTIRLRRATNSSEARRWIELLQGVPALAVGSLLFLVVSGIFLTNQISAWALAWPKVAVATLFVIGPLGAAAEKKLRAIKAASSATNPRESEILEKMRDPFLVFSVNLRVALVIGIVLLMVVKPGLAESLSIIAAFAIVGIVASLLLKRDSISKVERVESRQ